MTAYGEDYLTIHELAFMMGRRTQVIQRLVTLELIEPVHTQPEICFSPDIVPRIRRLFRLHDDLGISWTSMDLFLQLLDRLNSLEEQLSEQTDE